MNIYSGIRLFGLVKYFLPSFWAFIFWPLYILLCYSLAPVTFLRLDRIWFFRQAGLFSLPFFFYFFLVLVVLDALRLVLLFLKTVPPIPGLSAALTAISLAAAVLFMVYGSFNARNINTVSYAINLNKSGGAQGSGLRITLVSDLHIGATVGRKWIANIVDAVNLTKPDIICLAGDIFDSSIDAVPDLEGAALELAKLDAPLGVYACRGNHDRESLSEREGTAPDRMKEFLKNASVVLLQDEALLVADSFYLAGRRDARPIGGSSTRKTAAQLAAGLDRSRPIIFMDHHPVDFRVEDDAGVDLILSGHTHRGQVFPGSIVTGRMFKYPDALDYGRWQGRSAQAVISSGAGVWGPPLRIGTRSEVVVIEVSFGKL
jgi:predicted MPP superfamily phosphohydrolase